MLHDFISAKKLTGRFAIVKLWPEIKAAEDECIARLKIAATALGLDCLEIYSDGSFLHDDQRKITPHDVDFVLHLHYDTPKLYDAFSFVALWNPLDFYHQWGYARCSRNLLSHDDFISCGSEPADHHVARLIKQSPYHLSPLFNIYHSLSDIVHPPSLGEQKLFYVGINWERLGGGVSRHQALLKWLDKTGVLKIYGPHIFQGVKVWDGYKSYVKEIPFDGISIVNEINQAGISLVLSSAAHKDAKLMSSRLFESIAAGALVICDENAFAKNFFGDALLYIDMRCPVEEVGQAIVTHLNWIEKNPQAALAMIHKAQCIFKEKFSLKKSLQALYEGLSERKQLLRGMTYPSASQRLKISVNFLMPTYDKNVLAAHLASITAQDYRDFSPTLVIDREEAEKNQLELQAALAQSAVPIHLLRIDYFSYRTSSGKNPWRKMGEIITDILMHLPAASDAFILVAPNEKLFSNHLRILTGSLTRHPQLACAATAAILQHDQALQGNHEIIDFRQLDSSHPWGYGRFIFRKSMLPTDLHIALPYLDRKALAVLVGEQKIQQEIPATVLIQTDVTFPEGAWNEGQENELIASFCPSAFTVHQGFAIQLPALASAAPAAVSGRFKFIKWVIRQIDALQRQGLAVRIQALGKKIKRFAVS